MERLTIDEIIEHCDRKTEMYEKTCDVKYLETTVMNNPIKGYWEHKQVAEYLRKLKAYENLEEQGRLVKLPCKVGDTVYAIGFDNKPIIYMSDEELAESNLCPHMVNWKKGNYDTCVHPNDKDACKKCMLDWLQSEVE